MTVIWLIVWLAHGTPSFEFTFHNASSWFISLIVCAFLDLCGSRFI